MKTQINSIKSVNSLNLIRFYSLIVLLGILVAGCSGNNDPQTTKFQAPTGAYSVIYTLTAGDSEVCSLFSRVNVPVAEEFGGYWAVEGSGSRDWVLSTAGDLRTGWLTWTGSVGKGEAYESKTGCVWSIDAKPVK